MTTSETWTRLVDFSIKTSSRAGIDNLCAFLMAGEQDVGDAHDGFRGKCRIKLAFRQFDVTFL